MIRLPFSHTKHLLKGKYYFNVGVGRCYNYFIREERILTKIKIKHKKVHNKVKN